MSELTAKNVVVAATESRKRKGDLVKAIEAHFKGVRNRKQYDLRKQEVKVACDVTTMKDSKPDAWANWKSFEVTLAGLVKAGAVDSYRTAEEIAAQAKRNASRGVASSKPEQKPSDVRKVTLKDVTATMQMFYGDEVTAAIQYFVVHNRQQIIDSYKSAKK